MKTNDDHTIGINVEENGHIVLNTTVKEIPTEIVQAILDNVVSNVIDITRKKCAENNSNENNHVDNSYKLYRIIAILEFIALILIAFKLSI